jgi:hypothetical protein
VVCGPKIRTRLPVRAEDYFSPDYESARTRFRETAHAAGATLYSLPLADRSPCGEALSIEIAWLGSARAQRVFMHLCGVHGVEAYTGSAVQLALFDSPVEPPPGHALVLVHVVNPYGMAWLRRTNEHNVDLNRNFLVQGERWEGAPPLYAVLDPLLNPPSPPSRDAFVLRALGAIARYGLKPTLQAVAQGQYEFPRGLFFGGRELEPGARLLTEWLRQHLCGVEHLFAFDLHTGLGPWGGDLVVPEHGVGVTPVPALAAALGRSAGELARPSIGYTVRGLMGAALPHLLPQAKVDFLLQEIGTYRTLTVFSALRDENRWHFHGDGGIDHRAKRRLVEALCPASVAWRRQAIRLGADTARKVAQWMFTGART